MKEFSLLIEENHWRKGCKLIAGIDEVGRGALAGPLFACAVIFKPYYFDERIKDSKKLSAQTREKLYNLIKEISCDWSMGIASAAEIDRFNIRNATFLAMNRALHFLTVTPDIVLIDGNGVPGSNFNERAIINGDEKSFTIAAASIMAKVKRDEFMFLVNKKFPEYGFDHNKGYGTTEHVLNIKKFGPCVEHRISFLKNIYQINWGNS
jgi:ribonuclease HII